MQQFSIQPSICSFYFIIHVEGKNTETMIFITQVEPVFFFFITLSKNTVSKQKPELLNKVRDKNEQFFSALYYDVQETLL